MSTVMQGAIVIPDLWTWGPVADEVPEKTLEQLQEEHGALLGSRLQEPKGEMHEHGLFRNYVRDLVLGYNDGLVSVYALTAGVAGAAFGANQILMAGIAAAVAGALSMAAGEYISTKSQTEYYEAERNREREHIAKWPDLERKELLESLQEKGLEGDVLHRATEAIASDDERFLDYMMRDEFGIGPETDRDPWKASIYIVIAFLVGAALPVVPYAFADGNALRWSTAASVAGLFVAGVVRARTSRLNPWKAGLEMVFVGVLAATITFLLGSLVGAQI